MSTDTHTATSAAREGASFIRSAYASADTPARLQDGSPAHLTDGAPEWLQALGERLDEGPRGYLLHIARQALVEIGERTALPDEEEAYDMASAFAEGFVSDWTQDRVAWLSEAPVTRSLTCDDAAERFGLDENHADMAERLACGQRLEAMWVFDEVLGALRDLAQ